MRAHHLTLLLVALLSSGQAQASGEEVLLLPVGQVAAVCAVALLGLAFAGMRDARLVSLLAALAVCAIVWLVPGKYFPELLRYSGWGNFIIGLLPPLVVGGAAWLIAWGIQHHAKRNL